MAGSKRPQPDVLKIALHEQNTYQGNAHEQYIDSFKFWSDRCYCLGSNGSSIKECRVDRENWLDLPLKGKHLA